MSHHTFSPIVTDGLIYYIDFLNGKSFDGVSTICYDLVKFNVGNFSASPTVNEKWVDFDGVGDYVDFGSISELQFGNVDPFSISIWFNWQQVSSTFQTLFSYALSGGRGYYIILDATGALGTDVLFSDYFDGNPSTFRGILSANFPKNVWSNMVLTTDSSNSASGMKFYLNGEILSSSIRNAGTPNSIDYTSSPAPSVNVAARGGGSLFEGYISSVMVYNKELNSDEVLTNYNAFKNRFL